MPAVRLRQLPPQLSLFPGRQRRPPAVLEFPKQCVLADACFRWISPGWKWNHLPFGEYRTKATAGKLKRMGVQRGWPDLVFIRLIGGLHHYIELKRDGMKRTEDQDDFAAFCLAAGIPYLCSTDLTEIWARLQAWGAVNPNVRI